MSPVAWLAASGRLLQRLLHDLKQPLNYIRVVAQDVRLDVQRGRLDPGGLPASMAEIERTVDDLVRQLGILRPLYHEASGPGGAQDGVAGACQAALERARADHAGREIRATLEPALPAVSLGSAELEPLVHGLLDAALRGGPGVVELRARRMGPWVAVAAVDPAGVPPFFPVEPGGASMGAVLLLPLREPLETPEAGDGQAAPDR